MESTKIESGTHNSLPQLDAILHQLYRSAVDNSDGVVWVAQLEKEGDSRRFLFELVPKADIAEPAPEAAAAEAGEPSAVAEAVTDEMAPEPEAVEAP